MRNYISEAIQFVAMLMFVLGIIGLTIFKFDAIICISSITSSIIVYGFSFVVEAACKYLNRCEYEEYSSRIKKNEEGDSADL